MTTDHAYTFVPIDLTLHAHNDTWCKLQVSAIKLINNMPYIAEISESQCRSIQGVQLVFWLPNSQLCVYTGRSPSHAFTLLSVCAREVPKGIPLEVSTAQMAEDVAAVVLNGSKQNYWTGLMSWRVVGPNGKHMLRDN